LSHGDTKMIQERAKSYGPSVESNEHRLYEAELIRLARRQINETHTSLEKGRPIDEHVFNLALEMQIKILNYGGYREGYYLKCRSD